jgi:hypothetical protein
MSTKDSVSNILSFRNALGPGPETTIVALVDTEWVSIRGCTILGGEERILLIRLAVVWHNNTRHHLNVPRFLVAVIMRKLLELHKPRIRLLQEVSRRA